MWAALAGQESAAYGTSSLEEEQLEPRLHGARLESSRLPVMSSPRKKEKRRGRKKRRRERGRVQGRGCHVDSPGRQSRGTSGCAARAPPSQPPPLARAQTACRGRLPLRPPAGPAPVGSNRGLFLDLDKQEPAFELLLQCNSLQRSASSASPGRPCTSAAQQAQQQQQLAPMEPGSK